MLTLRPHLLASLALTLLACSPEPLDGDPLYQKINASYPNLVWLASAMPAQVGTVRIKVNGKFLVWDLGDGWDFGDADPPYVYIEGGTHQLEVIPSGTQLDLVGSAGQTLLHFEAPEPFTSPARVWLHDSPAGLAAAVLDTTPDDDPTTVEVTVVSASASERVIVSRCVGVIECEDCDTRPPSDEYGEFSAVGLPGAGHRRSRRAVDFEAGADQHQHRPGSRMSRSAERRFGGGPHLRAELEPADPRFPGAELHLD